MSFSKGENPAELLSKVAFHSCSMYLVESFIFPVDMHLYLYLLVTQLILSKFLATLESVKTIDILFRVLSQDRIVEKVIAQLTNGGCFNFLNHDRHFQSE